MAETLRIEIPIETIDETSDGIDAAVRGLEKLSQAMRNSKSQVEQTEKAVSKFDKQAEKTEKSLAKWAKEKYEVLLEAKDRISPILSTIGSGLKSFAGKTWSVTMRAVDFITSPVRGILNLLKNPIFQAGAVLGVSIGLKDTIDTYKDFEAAMSQVQAISGATSSELSKLTSKAREMGATTKFTATESAEAFNYMAMAGWKTEDMLGGIDGILSLAAASGEDLATTSDIVTDALTAFNMTASESGRFADVLAQASSNANTNVSMMGESFKYVAPVAGAMKYSVEDVSLALGLMANASIKGSMSGTSLKTALANLAAPTDQMKKNMDKYGISLTDSNGKMKTLRELLDNLRSGMGGLAEAEQTAAASAIFGKEAMSGMLAIINASEEDYNKLAEAVNNAGGAAAQMSETMLDNLEGSMIRLQSAVDGVKVSFGERLSPYVRNLAEWLTGQMPAIEQGLNDFMDWLDKDVDRLQRKFEAISETKEWQDADFFGKVKIAWDEFIAEPFSEWWSSTGKAKFAGFAQDIGEGIGTGLKFGIMTLLGIDLGETLDEGVSIGASFAKGFSKGFDFKAVSEKLSQGFSNLLSNAGKLLPGGESAGLSSILSAVMLGKIASPFIKLGKGAVSLGKGLFGTSATSGTSIMSSFLGSATTGSGLLGKSGMFAINLGAGNLPGGASMSAAGLSVTGMAAGAGAIAAGATLVSSALDAYKAFKSDNRDEAKAYGESAAWKAGGVATGAGIGAALGSVIPGLGTAAGALIGAGVGGIAGWIKGNKVKEEYQKNVEEMEKEAERVKKVYEVTGLSVDKVRFANQDLNAALKDTSLSTEELANLIQEDMARVAKDAFGDIHLSLTEIKKLAEEITFGNAIEAVNEFAKATETADNSLSLLKSTVSTLKKENWKASLEMKLEETEQDNYKKAIDNFTEAAKQYIEDNHHQATVALELLTGESGGTEGLNKLYSSMKSQIDDLTAQLAEKVEISLQDGVIQLNEQEEIANLQQQIQDITDKITAAKEEAQLDVLKVKYGNGSQLDIESFNSMQEELKAQVESWQRNYESALEVTLTNLNLQQKDAEINHNNGLITDEEYKQIQEEIQRQTDEAINGYTAEMNEMHIRVRSFNLEAIAGAWEEQLDGILPDLEGSLSEKLSTAMNNALLIKPDVSTWTQEDVMEWFDLDGIDTSAFENIYAELKATAEQVPDGVKEQILENYQSQIPTVEEIMEKVDFTSFTRGEYGELTGTTDYYSLFPTLKLSDAMLTGEEADFDELRERFARNIHEALEKSKDPEVVNDFINTYMTEWQVAGSNYADILTAGVSESLINGAPTIRAGVQTMLDTATESPYTASPIVNINPKYKFSGVNSLVFPSFTPAQNAAGGYVSGGPQLSWLAEEGYGEFVIPTNPSRRTRALELYEQAGAALGVSAHADGGYVGGSILSDSVADYNFFQSVNRNVPMAYNEFAEGNYDGEAVQIYEPAPAERTDNSGSSSVQVSVNVTPEFVIHRNSGQSEEEIMQVIRRHMKEMADELGGEIAGKLEEVFSNMPLKEA